MIRVRDKENKYKENKYKENKYKSLVCCWCIWIISVFMVSTSNVHAAEIMRIINDENSPNIVFFGDSITYGVVSIGRDNVFSPDQSYTVTFANRTNTNVYNYAFPGATMCTGTDMRYITEPAYSLQGQISAAESDGTLAIADYIYVYFGANDFMLSFDISNENPDDLGYFTNAFGYNIKALKEINSNAKIIVLIPHYSFQEYNDIVEKNDIGYTLQDYRDFLTETCAVMELEYLDMSKCGLNADNETTFSMTNKIHLTAYGYEYVGIYLADYWLDNYSQEKSYFKIEDDKYCLYKNGERSYETGIVHVNKADWYCVDGVIQTCRVLGNTNKVQTIGSKDYYVIDGRVQTYTSGLIIFRELEYQNSPFRAVINGQIVYDYNGLLSGGEHIWVIKDGEWDINYQGIYQVSVINYYAVNGKIDKTYKGIRNDNGTFYYVSNARVRVDYSGLVYNSGVFWYCKDGIIDCNYSGSYIFNGVNYFIVNGKVDSYTGLREDKNTHIWYYVYNGRIPVTFVGKVWFNNKYWDIENGVVVF